VRQPATIKRAGNARSARAPCWRSRARYAVCQERETRSCDAAVETGRWFQWSLPTQPKVQSYTAMGHVRFDP